MKIYTENFTILLNSHITNKEIDTYEFRVMCYLLMLSDDEGTCYPSYKTIADRIGISETKAKDSIKKLITLGLIKKEKRKKADGSATSNLYVVCEKTTVKVNEVIEDTASCVQDNLPCCSGQDAGSMSNGCNKYSNINTNYSINNHLSSIEDVMERAQTYNLEGVTKKNYESALEIMYNSKSILVGGETVPCEIVHKRLENISYEYIVYVDNNMPRKMVDGRIEMQVRSPVPYIITALYNALRYTEDEIIKTEYENYDVNFEKMKETG